MTRLPPKRRRSQTLKIPPPDPKAAEVPEGYPIEVAIANAVFPATGNRVRDLPITLDKVL